ncbi:MULTISPECIES: NAD-dependent epimerase/dehydratase family protein [Nocardia]|uniref:NAD-dependent epimerase/dehydratase family protein n=1 Tax=Nocardia TaxID=1817 RepID=UPI000D694417|nr:MULTISPECIES: NAD(P)-dependent oxidoreductase [Nocardia]
MSVNTILVTGGFGQVGKRCCEILLDRGRTVIAMDLRTDRSVATAEELSGSARPGTLVPAFVDLLDPAAVAGLVGEHRPDAIVHMAASLAPASYLNPAAAHRVNVEGTGNVVAAATALDRAPLLILASSASVYGSRNPYRYPELVTDETPVDPIDHYGRDKLLAETIIRESGLPYAVLRLGGVISPDGMSSMDRTHLVLIRATPRDNRIHAVDARDVALAFANAVDRADSIDGRILLIAGDESYRKLQRELEDDMTQSLGLGRLGPSVSLPGDPADDRGWTFTGWFDTTESEALLDFQRHTWSETREWIAHSQARSRTLLLRTFGPVLRPAIRLLMAVQRRRDGRGDYADPWALFEKTYGPDVLANKDSERP